MRKVTAFVLVLVCMLGGCGQKEALQEATPTLQKEIISIIQTSGGAPSPTVAQENETEENVFWYENTKKAERFAVDEEGLLYTTTYNLVPENILQAWQSVLNTTQTIQFVPENPTQTIQIYDWDGNCMEEHVLDITDGKAHDLLVGEHYLYLLAPEEDCSYVLYQIDRTTWEAKRLYRFTEFKAVWDMVLLGDTIYVLGEYENVKEKEFLNYQDWYDRANGRDYVVAYMHINEETPELDFVPFDLPWYIFAVNEDTLGIYGYEDRYTYRLFAYSPEDNTFEGISASYSISEEVSRRPFQCYEDGIFMRRTVGAISYVNMDGTEHEVLQTDEAFYIKIDDMLNNRKVIYANGCLFYQDMHNSYMIERVTIEDKLKEIQAK